jgi:hypothetical protein
MLQVLNLLLQMGSTPLQQLSGGVPLSERSAWMRGRSVLQMS